MTDSYLKASGNIFQNKSFLPVNTLSRRKLLSTIPLFILEIKDCNFVHFNIIETDLGINAPICLRMGKKLLKDTGKKQKVHMVCSSNSIHALNSFMYLQSQKNSQKKYHNISCCFSILASLPLISLKCYKTVFQLSY